MLLKIKLIKQDNAGHLFYFVFLTNKTKTKTHTYTQKKKTKKEHEMKLLAPAPSLFILNGVSINHMINGMPFL